MSEDAPPASDEEGAVISSDEGSPDESSLDDESSLGDERASDDEGTSNEKGTSDKAPARPLFARDYPADPSLDALLSAYAAGNFGYVREHAQALAQDTEDEGLRAAAIDLRRRIEPHPLATILWALGLALLVLLFGYYLTAAQGH